MLSMLGGKPASSTREKMFFDRHHMRAAMFFSSAPTALA